MKGLIGECALRRRLMGFPGISLELREDLWMLLRQVVALRGIGRQLIERPRFAPGGTNRLPNIQSNFPAPAQPPIQVRMIALFTRPDP